MNGPLDGLRVLDLTTFLSGPFATQILADLGAEVIKVESVEGDSSRAIPPHYVAGQSVYYLSTNRGKRSIVLDLKTSQGAELAQRLVLQSDVVFENFRPGVAARLGLDREALRKRKQSLIWTSITGFGSTGDWSNRPAYDMIVQALSGVMSLTGHEGGPAARLGIPAGDTVAGLFGVIGTLAAIHERRRTGAGATVDVSMLDSMLTMLSYQAAYAGHTGIAPKPQGAAHDSIPTYRSFRGSDGREFVVTANTERMWRAMCEQLGLPQLVADPRFDTARSRQENRAELGVILDAAFLTAPSSEWVDRLVRAQVPVAPIKSVPEALADAQSRDRGMLVRLDDLDAGEGFVGIATPVEFDGARPTSDRYPPRLGDSTVEILKDLLDLSPAEIDQLLRNEIAHQAPPRERAVNSMSVETNGDQPMKRVAMNPRLAALLREGARAGRRPVSSIGVAAARAQIEARSRPRDVPLAAVIDESIVQAGHRIPVRIYEPHDLEAGTIVFAHGGGWVLGSIGSHDGIAQRLALHSRARVVSVDYRLAPEHPFPAGLDDVAAALAWTSERFGGPVAVAGDSAGANLAAVLARHDRDSGRGVIRAQLLIYPVADSDTTRPSYAVREEEAALENLTMEDMSWCWSQYVPDPDARTHPDVAPLRADSLAGLAPAIVVLAGHDPLLDEGREYARRLSEGGVATQLHEHADLCHGFLAFLERLPEANETVERVGGELGELLRRAT